jgi:hypothetical protein
MAAPGQPRRPDPVRSAPGAHRVQRPPHAARVDPRHPRAQGRRPARRRRARNPRAHRGQRAAARDHGRSGGNHHPHRAAPASCALRPRREPQRIRAAGRARTARQLPRACQPHRLQRLRAAVDGLGRNRRDRLHGQYRHLADVGRAAQARLRARLQRLLVDADRGRRRPRDRRLRRLPRRATRVDPPVPRAVRPRRPAGGHRHLPQARRAGAAAEREALPQAVRESARRRLPGLQRGPVHLGQPQPGADARLRLGRAN